MALKIISLYLFSMHGIILWDEYPTYNTCMTDKHYFERKFADLREVGTFSAECVELGKTTQELMRQEGVFHADSEQIHQSG